MIYIMLYKILAGFVGVTLGYFAGFIAKWATLLLGVFVLDPIFDLSDSGAADLDAVANILSFFALLFTAVKVYQSMTKNTPKIEFKKISSAMKTDSKKILNFIYPPVRHDILWHRVVLVVGWIFSICSLWFFPLTFIIYFAIIQRAIMFVVYGDKREKWLIPHSKS